MPKTPNATDFPVDVDKIGRFMFARRAPGDTFKIRGRYNHMTDGFYDDSGNMADISALAFVSIQTLLVSSPDDFDLSAIDPIMDDNWEDKIIAIWTALREKELSFRPKSTSNSEASRPVNGGKLPVMVSDNLQPATD